jgi:hypothetical protein
VIVVPFEDIAGGGLCRPPDDKPQENIRIGSLPAPEGRD